MILLGLGANLPSKYGSPLETLEKACERIEQSPIKIIQRSSFWLTEPVPVSEDPWYHNCVIEVETRLKPRELLYELQKIEQEFGRVRLRRNEPRVLDLDILVYRNYIINEEDMIIPHPRLHERAFVLYPIYEISSNCLHPILQKNCEELIAELPSDQKIKKL
jgi:2-amino-4-hydroxy-6-hydroxymethyldihydropteridine diphosphokinase